MAECSPTPIETLYSTTLTVVPSTIVETTTRDGLLNLGLLGPETTQTFTRSTFVASQVLIPTSTIYGTPSSCRPSSTDRQSTSSHSSSLTFAVTDTEHSTTRTTTAPILSPTESAGRDSSLLTTDQKSTSTLITAVSTGDRSTVYLTLTATFSHPLTVAVATQTATLVGEGGSEISSQGSNRVKSGPIAGGIVGGILALGLLGFLSLCLYRKRRRKRVERATSDLKTVLAGGNLNEKASTAVAGSRSGTLSRNRLAYRFSWGDELDETNRDDTDGFQVQMDGNDGGLAEGLGVEPYESKVSTDDNPRGLSNGRTQSLINSSTNSVSGHVHGSTARGGEGHDAATGLLLSRPSFQQASSSSSNLLSSQSIVHLIPGSPMSLSQDPLTNAPFIPNSPSSIPRPISPLIQNHSPDSVSPPLPLFKTAEFGNDGETRVIGGDNQILGDGAYRPPRERQPSNPLPVRSWSQTQQSFSNNGAFQYHPSPPFSPGSPPFGSPSFQPTSPQKSRHSSFNSSRPTSPGNNQRNQQQRQSSYHSSKYSPNGNLTSELPPSRYSHLDWPKPAPTSNSDHFNIQRARSASAGLLSQPEEGWKNQVDSVRSNLSASPPPISPLIDVDPKLQAPRSNPSSQSNSPINSRPTSKTILAASHLEHHEQQVVLSRSKQSAEPEKKRGSNDDDDDDDGLGEAEMWLDANE